MLDTTLTDELQNAAVRGAVLLDEYVPGWADRIDLDTLDMSSGCKCIVAQLNGAGELGVPALTITGHVGSFTSGFHALESMLPFDLPDAGADYGFFASLTSDYYVLQGEWRRQIATRVICDE